MWHRAVWPRTLALHHDALRRCRAFHAIVCDACVQFDGPSCRESIILGLFDCRYQCQHVL